MIPTEPLDLKLVSTNNYFLVYFFVWIFYIQLFVYFLGIALSFLIDIHMRPDPLFNELANGVKNADEASVRDTYLQVIIHLVYF